MIVEGANLRIANGRGLTETTNGLGNLILGYNENQGLFARGGSHNLVIGPENDYESFGGFVLGVANASTAGFATVIGGGDNRATELFSVITGGSRNTATGMYSTITGGEEGHTASSLSSVVGGFRSSADELL